MKYPTKIKIKNREYLIEYVNEAIEVNTDFSPGNWLGVCDEGVIRVRATQTTFDVFETLLHEIVHAIFNRNRLLKTTIKKGFEEDFIDSLSTELTEFLFKNAWIKLPTTKPPITERIKKC